MRITTQGDYALRCLLNIAGSKAKEPVSIGMIAKEENLPVDYIEQLLMKLRRRKLIKSVRGAKGGYLLNKKPQEISLRSVIEAVEREPFEIICQRQRSKKGRHCFCTGDCRLKKVWVDLKRHVEGFLDSHTVASLLAVKRRKKGRLR